MAFEKKLQWIAEQFGILIYKKGKRRIKMKDSLAHLKKLGFEPNTVIDVGVAYGTEELYQAFPNAKILLFEPLEEYRETLDLFTKKYDAKAILAAAGKNQGKIILNVYPEKVGSSIYLDHQDEFLNSEQREIDLTTIDVECINWKTEGPYLIKIDVQGAELEVIAGAKKILKDSEVIILETSLYEFYRGSPLINTTIQSMHSLGFVVFDLMNAHYRPLDSSLAQIDIVFVQKNGRFRKDHRYTKLSS